MKYKEHKVFCEDQNVASIKIIADVVRNFDDFYGGEGERNTIKNVTTQDLVLNIKSFKVPHLVNRIAYSFFRKSKANRSFEYANDLIKKGIKTPKPFAYFEYSDLKLSSTFMSATKNRDERPIFILNKIDNENYIEYNPIVEKNDIITIKSLYNKFKYIPDNLKYLISLHNK